ncbi:AMP-dependent synthetase/ligase [Aquibaculum arenosum]|uniref:AMP-dependent synthetase/ligase n=1 Tax=Aquibaculum arenosum TaxID=3032591 RepID=A0ABT5YJM5_9PROT|nr:AMP-dependent synthetase/ligase [Fodinicurvata sp. CAU 1616]MDF2095108.1 AMP-dependent synthetase/ligase [Fodinicurvata sp. CAU 1616]
MDYTNAANLPAVFFEQAERLDSRPFLWAKREGRYQPWTWAEVAAEVCRVAAGLSMFGVTAGDRVLLVSENRPEWFIADFAIMALGAITVPAYTTNRAGDHRHILADSGACCAIVSTAQLAAPLCEALPDTPDCRHLVTMDEAAALDGPWSNHAWGALAGPEEATAEIVKAASNIARHELACIIYTSGTGGAPKGVMLSHGNILANCLSAYDLLNEYGIGEEVFLSFLPLSHSYEHTAGHIFPVTIAAQIYYAEGVETLLTNLAEAQPTIMTAVPRLYEAMYQRIHRGLRKEPTFKQWLFAAAERIGRKRYADPNSLTLWERIFDLALERLVRDKVRQRFGGRLKAMISGGAPLNPEIGLFFHALGLRILQGYGQTEASPVVSANRPFKIKMHSVGPPLKGVEVALGEDGEILVRGELVMQGYWRDEAATQATLRDGWLHTGDIGSIDADGYISITDRKKDIIVLSGGDNISPARVEGKLSLQPEIGQVMVMGDRRPHLVALIVPDETWLQEWARSNGKRGDLEALFDDSSLRKSISEAVERVNGEVSNMEKVRRFLIAPEPFSVHNGMITPTLKVRRHAVRAAFGEKLEALYERR